ncbi:hypothetical protein JAAARDRAFT_61958 [Jaapia argillacea MUCL 33604]|uniref:Pali-domain-containing protein n=1 Tax=Jaapia argillacea MUCL 33604 TaxID=933084 RepID=A0A067PMA3_9AGAM|nr:hypothetical protein JAAARDRAFT_61958 [Jaapia argillacea MUCL 33604]
MSYRTFCIPGVVLLACAFVLSFLVSISVPHLRDFDIVRVSQVQDGQTLKQFRASYSRRGYCVGSQCEDPGHGYELLLFSLQNGSSAIIGSSWTRGLAVHPVATGFIFVALLLSLSSHVTVTLAACIVSFLAAFLTFLAFIIDIVLDAYVHHQIGKISGVGDVTVAAGPAFWLTLVTLILLLLAGCTVCFGRRRAYGGSSDSFKMSEFGSGGFLSRFRR